MRAEEEGVGMGAYVPSLRSRLPLLLCAQTGLKKGGVSRMVRASILRLQSVVQENSVCMPSRFHTIHCLFLPMRTLLCAKGGPFLISVRFPTFSLPRLCAFLP